jgi:hypothetical protein
VGLISELHHEVKDANAIRRVTQKVAASGPGAWVWQRTVHPIDKGLDRLANGQLTVPSLMAGLPVIMLATTKAKMGRSQTMPPRRSYSGAGFIPMGTRTELPSEVPMSASDPSLAFERLGWSAKVSPGEVLQRTINAL